MAAYVQIRRAAQELDDLARDLRGADKMLRRELYKGLNRATKPLRADAKQRATRTLPRGGGLNRRVAGARMSTKRRGGQNAGVRIEARRGRQQVDVSAIDRGTVRHLTFGRGPWHTQRVRAGWFTGAMRDGAPQARREVAGAVERVTVALAAGRVTKG